MANTVDALNVRIDADLAPLRRALRQTSRSVQQTSERMKKSFSGIGASVTALGKKFGGLKGIMAGAFVGGMVAAGASVGRTAAEFQDLQKTLDVVFGSAEAGQASMQYIQKFAQQTPFDIQTLSKAFIQLKGAGIDPTTELLTTFGDAASATTNKVQSFEAMVRIATRAVGGGLGLEELEQLASAGIPVYQILTEEIGITRDQISEMGQTAEGASQIMDALQNGLNRKFGGAMADSLKTLSTSLSNMKIAATNMMLALGTGLGGGTGLTGAFTMLNNTLFQVFVILKPLAHALGFILGAALRAVLVPIRAVTEGILLLARGVVNLLKFSADALPDSFVGIKEAADRLDQSLTSLEEKMNGNAKVAEVVVQENKEVTAVLEAQAKAAKKAQAELNGFTDAEISALDAAGLLSQMDFGGGVTSQPLDLTGDINAVLAAVSNTAVYTESIQALQDAKDEAAARDKERNAEALRNQEEMKQRAAQIAQETQSKFQDISSTISNSLADAFVEGKNALDSLKEVFKGFVKQMIAKALELFVINQMMNAMFGLSGGSALPTRQLFGTRASGGAMSSNQPYLVGERGPELIVPNSASTAMNSNNTRSSSMGSSGTVVNQVINVSAGVSQTVRAEMLNLLPVIKQDTLNAVIDGQNRGGKFSKAFG